MRGYQTLRYSIEDARWQTGLTDWVTDACRRSQTGQVSETIRLACSGNRPAWDRLPQRLKRQHLAAWCQKWVAEYYEMLVSWLDSPRPELGPEEIGRLVGTVRNQHEDHLVAIRFFRCIHARSWARLSALHRLEDEFLKAHCAALEHQVIGLAASGGGSQAEPLWKSVRTFHETLGTVLERETRRPKPRMFARGPHSPWAWLDVETNGVGESGREITELYLAPLSGEQPAMGFVWHPVRERRRIFAPRLPCKATRLQVCKKSAVVPPDTPSWAIISDMMCHLLHTQMPSFRAPSVSQKPGCGPILRSSISVGACLFLKVNLHDIMLSTRWILPA
ncbi:MAG TPA: hypothetical protein PK297_11055 [Spirochaetota bacterium]|nr:hypothetical protein [Spirochaetota bacterium]